MLNFSLKAVAVAAMFVGGVSTAQAQTTLKGASMFDEEHAFTKTMREFERLVGEMVGDAVDQHALGAGDGQSLVATEVDQLVLPPVPATEFGRREIGGERRARAASRRVIGVAVVGI